MHGAQKTNTGPECLYGDRSYSQTGRLTLDWLTRTRRQNAAKWRALYWDAQAAFPRGFAKIGLGKEESGRYKSYK